MSMFMGHKWLNVYRWLYAYEYMVERKSMGKEEDCIKVI